MGNRIHTIDEIDDTDEFDAFGCKGCPDFKQCQRERREIIARMKFIHALHVISRAFFIVFKPVFNAINKRRGGVKCYWCHVYIVDPGEYCRNCGKTFFSNEPDKNDKRNVER